MTFKERIKTLISNAAGLKVLYVEDEAQIRENTHLFLETIFPNVQSAANGKEALVRYGTDSFDIVITDILMPELNGVGMIKKMKEIHPEQVCIVTSACEESSYLLELINLGVSQFLLKPIQTEQMVQVLFDVVKAIYNEHKVAEFTEQLKHDLIHQTTLLEQYKEVVDLSTIVTKTDLRGNITYANDIFCQTSGFDRDEVLAQRHNVLRHPEMNQEFYAELWKKILDKETWNGTIKNLKKNGEHYITETTIKPIVDEYGEIIEFISVSHDITELFDLNEEIRQTQQEMLSLLGEVGETRSQETGNHVRRVARYGQLLGELYGLEDEETQLLYSASPMHDIGKIGIPDAILLKPGKLDADEYAIMKAHAQIGYDIMKNSHRPLLQAAAVIAHEHHEKWDGSGYPNALQGDEIHIFGRITALADVFDALSCERVYKKPWPMDQIIDFIREERGKHFDPTLVDLFLDNLDRFIAISQELKD